MSKNQYFIVIFIVLLYGCDAWFFDSKIRCRQSINNLTSDTITIINSKSEIHNINIEKIICYPFSEVVFYDYTTQYQPLNVYTIPVIYEGSTIITSSNRQLIKDIFDNSKWDAIHKKGDVWIKFTITEDDLK